MIYKVMLMVLLIGALNVPAVGYAQEDEEGVVLFIGTVTDVPDEFVGLAIDGENATFYICDGNAAEGTVSIAQWFVGTAAENVIDITAPNGNRVEITLAEDAASGRLTFADGTVREFVMTLAEEQAALFRSEFTLVEDTYVGGWLVLADGSIRGAVFKSGSGELVAASFSGGSRDQWVDPDPD